MVPSSVLEVAQADLPAPPLPLCITVCIMCILLSVASSTWQESQQCFAFKTLYSRFSECVNSYMFFLIYHFCLTKYCAHDTKYFYDEIHPANQDKQEEFMMVENNTSPGFLWRQFKLQPVWKFKWTFSQVNWTSLVCSTKQKPVAIRNIYNAFWRFLTANKRTQSKTANKRTQSKRCTQSILKWMSLLSPLSRPYIIFTFTFRRLRFPFIYLTSWGVVLGKHLPATLSLFFFLFKTEIKKRKYTCSLEGMESTSGIFQEVLLCSLQRKLPWKRL